MLLLNKCIQIELKIDIFWITNMTSNFRKISDKILQDSTPVDCRYKPTLLELKSLKVVHP